MTALKDLTIAELPELVGVTMGPSDWIVINQDRVDQFAEVSEDRQWLHVDPERAAAGPFGQTVAHGLLTLSLFVQLWSTLLDVVDATVSINYGFNKVRFTAPVRVGARIRLRATITSITSAPHGIYQLEVSAVMEVEGQEKPAIVLEAISRIA